MADEEVVYSVDLLQAVDGETEGTGKPREEDSASEEGQMVYGMSGTFDLNEKFEVKEGQKIRLFLRAKCENGYRFEYDLFSGVVKEEGPNGFEETVDYFAPNDCVYDKDGNKYDMQ